MTNKDAIEALDKIEYTLLELAAMGSHNDAKLAKEKVKDNIETIRTALQRHITPCMNGDELNIPECARQRPDVDVETILSDLRKCWKPRGGMTHLDKNAAFDFVGTHEDAITTILQHYRKEK